MKAWQYMGNRQPIQLNEVPEPVLSPTQVLIDVKAAGLCHSDVMYMEVGDSAMPFLPMTQGHENAGVITALGSEVTGFKVGDVVGVCSSGVQPPLGMFTPGGFADKLAADYRDLARVPDGLDLSLAALATDAGMTSYHAMIKVGGAGKGMKVGVIGFGGLGQIGARYVVCGEDHRFGHKGGWDAKALERMCRESGIGFEAVPAFCLKGEKVSSSAIRQALQNGNEKEAEMLLGRAVPAHWKQVKK